MQSSVKVPIEYSIKATHIKVYSIIRTAKVELLTNNHLCVILI